MSNPDNLNIPSGDTTVVVRAFDSVDPTKSRIPAAFFLSPVLEGHEEIFFPAYAFLIENTSSKQRVMFDLGPRKDLENGATYVRDAVKAGYMRMPVSKDITEQLVEAGVELQSISAVVWRYVSMR